jgi:transcriptional regulator with XRE-family HTH domain
MTPAEIAAMRERTGISQAVLAAFMNVAVNTVSQWERGERRPTGAALKLLHVVSGCENPRFSGGRRSGSSAKPSAVAVGTVRPDSTASGMKG